MDIPTLIILISTSFDDVFSKEAHEAFKQPVLNYLIKLNKSMSNEERVSCKTNEANRALIYAVRYMTENGYYLHNLADFSVTLSKEVNDGQAMALLNRGRLNTILCK